jgi:AcrR family transcriptional regulator
MDGESEDKCIQHRKRCSSTTREAILDSAMNRFARHGFECSGVREIAADAGVTAALVNRYFGSKEGLFAAVLERAFEVDDMLECDLSELAGHLARHIVRSREGSDRNKPTPLLLLLRTAAEPVAVELLRKNLDDNFVCPLAARLEGEDKQHRAAMVAALMTGFATFDQSLKCNAIACDDRERLVECMTEYLNRWIRG